MAPTNTLAIRDNELDYHPNGKKVELVVKRPIRDDRNVYDETAYPNTEMGRFLRGMAIMYLIKQEPRMGWARKSACDEKLPHKHPCESVAAHQWGVAQLIATLSLRPEFQEELPDFDRAKAFEMALMHDIAEVRTGDITPADGIEPELKHKMEREAIETIVGCFPKDLETQISRIYERYEERKCSESKFVKDCDIIDFLITGFILERQGFSGFSEFFDNSLSRHRFSTRIATDLAETLKFTRDSLLKKGTIYERKV